MRNVVSFLLNTYAYLLNCPTHSFPYLQTILPLLHFGLTACSVCMDALASFGFYNLVTEQLICPGPLQPSLHVSFRPLYNHLLCLEELLQNWIVQDRKIKKKEKKSWFSVFDVGSRWCSNPRSTNSFGLKNSDIIILILFSHISLVCYLVTQW